MQINSYIISDLEEFKFFVKSNWDDINIVSFDIETNSVEEIKAQVWGIGLAFEDHEAFYLPLRDKAGLPMLPEKETVEFVTHLLQNKKVIAHNGIYDTLVWYHRYGIRLYNSLYADTILMKHTLDEEPPFGLKEVAVRDLGPWADKAQMAMIDSVKKNGGTVTKTNFEMYKCDTQILGEYCCWDVVLTRKLFDKYQNQLEVENLSKLFYEDEVMPLYREVTITMKERVIPIDTTYFTNLKTQITNDIDKLHKEVMVDIDALVADFEYEYLEKNFPVKRTGNFPKAYASYFGLELPSIAKKIIDNLVIEPEQVELLNFKHWMQGSEDLLGPIGSVQYKMFFDKNPESTSVFNLSSKHHLKWLFFERLQESPLSTTEKGEPQIDDDFLDSIAHKYSFVKSLQDLNKLEKIKGTYIEGLLERAHDGIIYTSFLQFGTTSGRFASRNPNLQNQPRPKEDDSGLSPIVLHYNNAIRAGFVAPEGYAFVDSDYSALEPRCFAHMSGDKNLQQIFHTGTDMYSAIAIRVFGLDNCSAFKKDPNFVGKLYPEKRQIIKALALAVTYGAESYRIADLLKIDPKDAQKLIDDYLAAYPKLRSYIEQCHRETNLYGKVSTIFGRVRHLKEAKMLYDSYGHSLSDSNWARKRGLKDQRRLYKNKLNNSTNFKIQALAGHIINRAMCQINRELNKAGIDGWVCLMVHDQVVVTAAKSQAEQAVAIVQRCMENVVKLDVPLVAEPKIAYNLRDSH